MSESNWLKGPSFLQDVGETKLSKEIYSLGQDDEEVKHIVTHNTTSQSSFYVNYLARFSSFNRLIRSVAIIFLWLCMFKTKKRSTVSSDDMFRAKISVIRLVQSEHYSTMLQSISSLPRNHPIGKFNCFIDTEGILRVGGRLIRSNERFDLKFPIVIPGSSQSAKLIIQHCHSLVFHQGRGMTLNSVRTSGFYILGSSSIVSRLIHNCLNCKKLRRATAVQCLICPLIVLQSLARSISVVLISLVHFS